MAYCAECGNELELSAKFCHNCGKSIKQKQAAASQSFEPKQQTTERTPSFSAATCPVCHSDSQVQKVSVIVDGGTINTQGVAVSTPFFNDHPIKNTYVTRTASTSSSSLAQRLFPPAIPIYPIGKLFFRYWIISSIPIAILSIVADANAYSGGQSLSPVVGVVIGLFFGFFVGIVIALFERKKLTGTVLLEDRQGWAKSQTRLRNSFYCMRDDVVFDHSFSGSPEIFISRTFSEVGSPNDASSGFLVSTGGKTIFGIVVLLCIFGGIRPTNLNSSGSDYSNFTSSTDSGTSNSGVDNSSAGGTLTDNSGSSNSGVDNSGSSNQGTTSSGTGNAGTDNSASGSIGGDNSGTQTKVTAPTPAPTDATGSIG